MPISRRGCSGARSPGRVSGNIRSARTPPTNVSAARIQNSARHPPIPVTTPPTAGANAGEINVTLVRIASGAAALPTGAVSVAIARPVTKDEDAPADWIARPISIVVRSPATAQISVPTRNTTIPPSNTGLRP